MKPNERKTSRRKSMVKKEKKHFFHASCECRRFSRANRTVSLVSHIKIKYHLVLQAKTKGIQKTTSQFARISIKLQPRSLQNNGNCIYDDQKMNDVSFNTTQDVCVTTTQTRNVPFAYATNQQTGNRNEFVERTDSISMKFHFHVKLAMLKFDGCHVNRVF